MAATAGAAATIGRRTATTADAADPPPRTASSPAAASPPRPPADPFGLDRQSTTGLAQRQGPAAPPAAASLDQGRVSAEDAATEAAVDALFSAIDTDGDGTLSADEVRGLDEALAQATGDRGPPPPPPSADTANAQWSAALQDLARQYAQVMADTGASGTVTVGLSVSLDA
jgi:hypothetical protein